jgi:AcrR family transcriptional regulator
VAAVAQTGTGLGRRSRRLSDQETERRMLDAAIAMVNESGLTVSLDHISFEDVIRDARVSRSTVYRRWPYKDLFFSDLLKELARATTPAAVSAAATSIERVKRIVLERLDWLKTPELRHELVLEMLRRGSLSEFETMRSSTEWRTYLALHTTFLSVRDETLRAELQAALAASERTFIRGIAASWELLAGLLGYRIRPELDASFETFASLASADLRGLVIMALATPDIATRPIRARPFGTANVSDWSLTALGLASIAMTFIEPDPGVVWDEGRFATVRHAFETLEAPARA